ncbi:ABC transporter permease [Pollutibacter soli]|uniref:ABC transporter permease n=1 Tax=Pollutibacter soli TaxID=3034157 RepID=UPI003013B9E0
MFTNYIKIAFRNLAKHKMFSLINIFGLAIGMTVCLLILQYVSFKLSYDQFNQNAKDIYRVVNDRYQQGNLIQHGTITYSGVGKAMNDDYDDVIANARVATVGETILSNGTKRIEDDHVFFGENIFFQMFDYPIIAGSRKDMLKEPFTIVITETLAKKIFDLPRNNFEDIIGKAIVLNRDSMPYRVDAVLKDVPENSHLEFSMIVSYPTLMHFWKESDYDFTQSDFWHYVQLKPGTDYKKINAGMAAFSKKHFQGNKISGSDEKFYLQPLSNAHLYSDFEYEIGRTGSATAVWGLLTIAIFIIVIGWVNYINLATARSAERAREVGIRKVVGGVRRQLISQFLFESIMVNLIALGLAVLFVYLLQSGFNQLLEQQLSMAYIFSKGMKGYALLIGLVTLIVTGMLLSGFYPAFVLSSFKPIQVLKGQFSSGSKGILLRKVLVISQFCITAILIAGAVIVTKQLNFLNKKDLGFDMNQVMIVKPPMLTGYDSSFINKVDILKQELKQIPAVAAAATSGNIFGNELGRSFNVRQADSASTNKYTVRVMQTDHDFIPLYGMKVIAGRSFDPSDHDPDGRKLKNTLINRSAVKLLGFSSPEAAIGKDILRGTRRWTVIGVLEDVHQKSLRYPMEATVFIPSYGTYNDISLKLKTTQNLQGTIEAIKAKYDAMFPGNHFDYFFLNDRFNWQYKNDQLFGKVFNIFAGVAIFVACLGLFGLVLFATVKRTKEIGVRKVLGASVADILVLLSKDFVKLIVIAIALATPASWYIMSRWLQDFSYRTEINWWIFPLCAVAALAIAMITIVVQSVRAANANPVKSLRTE